MSAILRKLQGGNLEVFKVSFAPSASFPLLEPGLRFKEPFLTHCDQFGMYVIFPIGWMYYFGTNLDERFSVPGFWPAADQSHKIPMEKEDIDKELARMRMVDAVKREKREKEAEILAQAQAQAQVQAQAQSQIQSQSQSQGSSSE